jgi:hypothetical protein
MRRVAHRNSPSIFDRKTPMQMLAFGRRAMLALSLVALGACSDDHDDENITVASARIEVLNSGGTATQTLTVTPNNVTGGPLALVRGAATTIRVTWLNGSGASDPANSDANFVVRFNPPAGSGLSFALNGGSRSTGVMTGSTAQSPAVQVGIQLYHTVENHTDFDARVPVTVTNPAT